MYLVALVIPDTSGNEGAFMEGNMYLLFVFVQKRGTLYKSDALIYARPQKGKRVLVTLVDPPHSAGLVEQNVAYTHNRTMIGTAPESLATGI
jgi:hypothetical protein